MDEECEVDWRDLYYGRVDANHELRTQVRAKTVEVLVLRGRNEALEDQVAELRKEIYRKPPPVDEVQRRMDDIRDMVENAIGAYEDLLTFAGRAAHRSFVRRLTADIYTYRRVYERATEELGTRRQRTPRDGMNPIKMSQTELEALALRLTYEVDYDLGKAAEFPESPEEYGTHDLVAGVVRELLASLDIEVV